MGGTYIGVDPGRSGGVCLITDGASPQRPSVVTISMPDHRCDLLAWLHNKMEECEPPYRIIVERVYGFMGSRSQGKDGRGEDGRGGNTGASMFVFGQSYGEILMALDALRSLARFELSYETVMPNVWQRKLGIPPKTKGETKGQYKGRLAETARRLYPFLQKSITLSTADAVLMAHYSRSVFEWP